MALWVKYDTANRIHDWSASSTAVMTNQIEPSIRLYRMYCIQAQMTFKLWGKFYLRENDPKSCQDRKVSPLENSRLGFIGAAKGVKGS